MNIDLNDLYNTKFANFHDVRHALNDLEMLHHRMAHMLTILDDMETDAASEDQRDAMITAAIALFATVQKPVEYIFNYCKNIETATKTVDVNTQINDIPEIWSEQLRLGDEILSTAHDAKRAIRMILENAAQPVDAERMCNIELLGQMADTAIERALNAASSAFYPRKGPSVQ